MLVRESSYKVIKIMYIEKVLSSQIVGEGIKRTPAYETPLTKHDLDKWRKEFWGKYIHNYRILCIMLSVK